MPLRLGRFEISRIAEIEDQRYPGNGMFPDADDAALRELARHLGPKLVDPATLELLVTFNCFIVRSGRHTVLVDSCVGNDKDRPTRPQWHRRQGKFLDQLAAIGVTPEDVDFVLCTHLHADHVGWNTRLVNGAWVPTFPKAQYLIAEPEYAYWKREHDSHPAEPVLHGSFADSVLPVVRAGQAVMVRMDHQVDAGLHLEAAVGHTPGNVVIHVEDGGRHAVLLGDVMHHPVQMAHPEWSTRFCLDPARSAQTRLDLLRRYADTETRLVTAHFPAPTFGCAVREGNAFGFKFDE
jgi:glyoxylase-like metal-dependent hydrolase (beta-lactamase superfamily II)